MPSVRNIYFIGRVTWLEGIRHRALGAIFCLAFFLGLANILFTSMFSWDQGRVAINFGLSSAALTGLLLIIFLTLKILNDDLEYDRIFLFLSRPVTIHEYIAGKYLGFALILFSSTIILGLSGACSIKYFLWSSPGSILPNFSWETYLMALLCQWLSSLIILALSFFWTSIASHSFIALMMTVLSYLVGQNIEPLRQILEHNSQEGILTGKITLVKVVSLIFPNLSLFDKKLTAAYGLPFSGQELIILTSYGITYSMLLIYFTGWFYQRKEIA